MRILWVSLTNQVVHTHSSGQEAGPGIHVFANTKATVRDVLTKGIGKTARGKTVPGNVVLYGADVYKTNGRNSISELCEARTMDDRVP